MDALVEVRVELETSESLAPGTVIRQTLAPAFERPLSAESSFLFVSVRVGESVQHHPEAFKPGGGEYA